MLNTRYVTAILAFLLLATSGALAQSQQPPKTPQVQTKQDSSDGLKDGLKPKGNTGESREEGTEFWPPFLGYRLKITDTLLAAFTFGLFVATSFLWLSTRKLVQRAEKTAERQLRAYVFPIESKFMNFDGPLSFHIKIANSGQTPAHNLRVWSSIQGASFPLDRELQRKGSPETSVINLAPGGFTWSNVFLKPEHVPLTEERKQALRSGTGALYVYGEATYDDIFGNRRFTRFRMMCGGPTGVHADCTLTNCEEGNVAN